MTRLRRIAAAIATLLVAVIGGGVGLDRIYPLDLGRLQSHSVMVLAADGSILRGFAASGGAWRFPATTTEVDPKFLKFLIAYEDQRFYRHPGVDPLAVLRATGQAIAAGHVVSGASTLTMQTARLLEPRPRVLASKLIEMARALQLEARVGKEGTLGIYLTLAPYGGNLEGIRAASLAYFGKEPSHLTEAEAALLVVLPQSPETLRPDRFPEAAKAARDKVLARLLGEGVIDRPTYETAIAEPAVAKRLPALNDAAHLALRLRLEAPGDLTIRTSVDADLQDRVEALAERSQSNLEPGAGIAVLVVDNAERRVIAYLGSADFFDDKRFGQNDMVAAIRSPGSALKPFIYGMAFEDLIVHPETVVKDVPMRFGDYAPSNFDHLFRGEVTAREALQLSLNLPAVALLDRIGPGHFAQRLGDAGAPLVLPDKHARPGLPIALGGVGINLERLVTLYAALAEGGVARPLLYRIDAAKGEGHQLMSPLAAWYVTRILDETPPPERWLPAGNRRNASTIAYKTGTSYGYRDAWAVGYNARFTVGVWVGRPDGAFSNGRMGRDAAAPILFQVFDQLPHGESAAAATPPAGAILGGTNDLPVNLRRFDPQPGLETGAQPQVVAGPSIQSPVDGATLDLVNASLVLTARGGALPLRWLVNGKPVDSEPFRRQAEWQPDGRGAARVTVIDGLGRSASAAVWLK
ncbi:MAG TPA: penicillin-binding protein 1C [Candidatus Binatia bacterium]|nr:penicillin-binding protein 1C [Candidatus Binatia bacterium]